MLVVFANVYLFYLIKFFGLRIDTNEVNIDYCGSSRIFFASRVFVRSLITAGSWQTEKNYLVTNFNWMLIDLIGLSFCCLKRDKYY